MKAQRKNSSQLNLSLPGRVGFCLIAALALTSAASGAEEAGWISLFNGEDLDNWIIKFTGQELGVNYRNTFRVEDNLLTVSYDDWNDFNGEFGHLFYNQVFSHYRLRIEYRFVGEQVSNGPGWAFRNNGMMLHSQDPASMTVEQEFPVSLEAQLLGGNGSDPRSTSNVCTPGTNMVMNGELITQHCTNSSSQTYHGDQWVKAEFEVLGDESIKHWIDGELVFELQKPQLDERDPDAQALIQRGAEIMLKEGYVALQAESHKTQFRTIELLPLRSI